MYKYLFFIVLLLNSGLHAVGWGSILPTREQVLALLPTQEQIEAHLPGADKMSDLGEKLAEGMARGFVKSGAEHASGPLKAAKDEIIRSIKEVTPQVATTAQQVTKELHALADKAEKNTSKLVDTFFNKAHKFVYVVAGLTAASVVGYMIFKRWYNQEKKYSLPLVHAAHSWRDVIEPAAIREALLQKLHFIKSVRLMHAKTNSCLFRTLLLDGDRGTGKSAIAQLIARESDMPVVYIASAHFMQYSPERCFSELYKLCATATAQAECFMIIDNLDDFLALHDAIFVNKFIQLLVEVIGAHKNSCMVLGITRNAQTLPATLKQCFDDQITFTLPDYEMRKSLLLHYRSLYNERYSHLLAQPLSDYFTDEAIEALAQSSEGLSGAKLESMVSELVIQVTMS